MLVDCQYLTSSKRLILSYVDKTNKTKLKYYEWPNPLKYVNCESQDPHRDPKYKSWDGRAVKLVPAGYPDRYSIYEFLDALPEKEREEIFEFNEPEIYFIDIETEIIDGFPDAETAPTKVLSISIVYEDKIILLGLRDMPNDMQKRIIDNTNKYFEKFKIQYQFKYIKYADEFDMLKSFFDEMIPKMSCMTGWNFINYDWMYLVNRARKLNKIVNGAELTIDPSISSPTRRLTKQWATNYEIPAHKLLFDYMQLYEICDTSIKVKESSSLDFVASKLVGVEKIKYTGSLQKLYEDDFETFMYYNAVDSVLVQKIHESKNYISIIYAISSLSKIKIVDVISQMNNALGSLAITEGVLRGRFREMEDIVLFKQDDRESDDVPSLAGGWVKDPVTGMNQWVVCYDFASLYPTTQLEFFISPENFVGVQSEKNKSICTNGAEIDLNKHVVCVNGVVFRKHISPTLRMLEDVYADRKKAKKIMMQKKEELKKVQDEMKKLVEEIDNTI
jgi:DNA polymerase elongation subunit (family B)